MIRIFIVDDHQLIRSGYRLLLTNAAGLQIVGEAQNAAEALTVIPRVLPDLVICDYELPDQNGLFVVKHLLDFDPKLKILIVSVIRTGLVPRQLLAAGALGYVTKAGDASVLLRAIRQVSKGERYIDDSLDGAVLFGDPIFDALSGRLRDVLILMLEGKLNPEIAAELRITESTIRSHKSVLMEKVGVTSERALLAKAREAGFGAKYGR